MNRVLIIDDDEMICDLLFRHLRQTGYEAAYALTLSGGLKKARSENPDVVFLDVHMPDGNGLEALPGIKAVPSAPEVIIFTAQGDPEGAETAIRSGAWDYIEKPPTIQGIMLPLIRALQYREEKRRIKPKTALRREGIVGSGREIERCLNLAAEAANSESSVLITGETGTGKELFARAIHENSPRCGGSLVVVDCAALPETLVESTLFGHEKGAFTGADRPSEGLIRQADGGTLFLDEVGELPMAVQKAFLRFLQERRFRPVGSGREVESDFRLVAATNRNLEEMVLTGRFRSDLLFRLRSLVLDLPPLKGRTGDIRDIAMHYMTKFCDQSAMGTKGFSPEFLETLWAYHWPGNVRELIHALEKALSAARNEPTLHPFHLPVSIRIQVARASVPPKAVHPERAERGEGLREPVTVRELLDNTERQYLELLMAKTGGDIKEVCRISGLSRSSLYDRLKRYNIPNNL
jgi:two-component system NtrC family response regulator